METLKPITQDLTRSSFAAMGGVLLSRVSGVIRTIVVNSSFGAATALDAFNAAFRMPNCLRDLFADGALSAAFMTSLVEQKQKGLEEEQKLIAVVLGFFICTTLLLALLGVIWAPAIISLITESNFKHTGGLPIAIALFRILVFFLPLTMINAVLMAILGVHGQSFRAMNGSIFLSVGMIGGALIFAPFFSGWSIPTMGLAIGTLLGAFFQTLYQAWPLYSLKLLPLPNFNIKHWLTYKPLRQILRQMAPRALGQGAMVIALGINTYFATQIGTGFLTYIVTAVTIIQVPIGLFGVATGFAALPVLSQTLQQKDGANFSKLLVEGLRTSFWLATFTTICFALLIVPFYVVLFQHGKITYVDTIHNSVAICIYATGIILSSGNKVLINTLYALDATRQIVYNAIVYLIVNTGLNFLLVPKFGLIGIGFSFGVASSLDYWLNYFCIKRYFHKKGYSYSPYQQGGIGFTAKILGVNLLGFLVCFFGVGFTQFYWARLTNFNFWPALGILLTGGCVLLGLFIGVVLKTGPIHLRNIFLRKVQKASL